MSEAKQVTIPVRWRKLSSMEITAPGDWEWSSQHKKWSPVISRHWVNNDQMIIRRWSFAVGELVRFEGKNDGLRKMQFIVTSVLSSNASGETSVHCAALNNKDILKHFNGRYLRPLFAVECMAGQVVEGWKMPDVIDHWKAEDIINKIDPTNDPNVAPYLATETLGDALEKAELTEEPQADHSADADKMVEMPVIKQSLTTPKPKTLYIAGPMRGIAWFNYPMFDRIAGVLREQGLCVISPADEDRKQDGFDPFKNPDYANPDRCVFPSELDFHKTVRRCLEAVLQCEEIVLLPGWERSSGAVAELTLAMWLNKRVRHVRIDDADTVQFVCFWKGLESLAMDLCDEYHPEYVEPGNEIDVREEDEAADDILEEALSITRGSRNASYGPPDQDFRRTAGMWSALFASKLREGVTFEPRDVALAMILLKTSRETHQRKRDNWVDIAGYARCGSLCN